MIQTLLVAALGVLPAGDGGSVWDRLAECESGGDWALDAAHDGGLQFHPQTWSAMGGTDFAPAAWQASREQQIVIAERVYEFQGWGAWPGCAEQLGLGGDPDGYGGSQVGPSADPEADDNDGSSSLPPTR